MLFNSFAFCLLFLPIALLLYFGISRRSLRASIIFLMIASIVFYAYWSVRFLPLLLGSIAFNFVVGRAIADNALRGNRKAGGRWLFVGVAVNLIVLAIFKYLDFFGASIAALLNQPYTPFGIELPIGISFFTFTQIAFLVDCNKAIVRDARPESYGLFVTYFPHLIAGPILHHKDMMPQFERPSTHRFSSTAFRAGMTLLLIGMVKKILLADGVSQYVEPVFDLHHASLTTLEAWLGALAYTFQLYFDFSAYSDMAYGLSLMFGIVLPINFDSPYKSLNIIDFWRRWHISLSTFLRDYLYIPLGGSRKGSFRRYLNLLITMLLGGLWHGANWTFVIWGGLHGSYLILNHGFRHLVGDRKLPALKYPGWLLTFVAVVVAWVFFRATSLHAAVDILRAMFAMGPAVNIDAAVDGAGGLMTNRIMPMWIALGWIIVCAIIAFFIPNSMELTRSLRAAADRERLGETAAAAGTLASRTSGRAFRNAFLIGLMIATTLLLLTISETRGVSEFLYFNF